MTDAHADAAAMALGRKMNNGPYMMPPDVLDDAAAAAIAAYLASMSAAGWVMARVPDADIAPDEEYGLTEFREGRRVGWNACRAAMLADPAPKR